MNPPRLTDLTTPPVVGELYLVPTVMWRGSPVPLLGPEHEDPSFAPALGRHRHYDPRFVDLADVMVQIAGLTKEQVALVIAHKMRPDDEVVERPMRCLREMPPWPGGELASRADVAPWIGDLAEAHRTCRVGLDGRCPHAGTDGRSFPRGADGAWTCIHGLRWGRDGGLIS